jgi:hypothetical protein
MGYMEGGQDKKPNFGCHQIAELEGTLLNEDDGAQTHRHSLTIHKRCIPMINKIYGGWVG